MVRNYFEYSEKRLSFSDFMQGQGVLIERCNETIAVCNAMKDVIKKYDGKKQLKKYIDEVQGRVGDNVKVELTEKRRGEGKNRQRIYVTTKMCMLDSNDIRIKYDVLFTIWVRDVTDMDGKLNTETINNIANNEIRIAKAQQAKAKDECANFVEWDKALEDAMRTFYDKIKDIPDFFLDIEGRCLGEMRLR